MRKLFTSLLFILIALAAVAAEVRPVHMKSELLPAPDDIIVISPDNPQGRRFPVVYLLNGFGGDCNQFLRIRPDLPALSDRYGMIFVLPSGQDSWYWDSPEHPEMQMESFITKVLIPWVDKNYPTIADRDHRAVTGLSMGGHGALFLAMRHPDLFGSAASMSGGVDIRPFPGKWSMAKWLGDKDTHPQAWDSHTVMTEAAKLTPGTLNIAFDCGGDDFFAQVNKNLHRLLLEKKIPHDYTERPGTHSGAYWNNSLLYHLVFFDEAFKTADKK